MATNDGEWTRLKVIMVDWITNHAELNIDTSLASWLDNSGSILKDYQRHKTSLQGVNEPFAVTASYLLEIWKSRNGSGANPSNMLSILKQQKNTAEAIEKIQNEFANDKILVGFTGSLAGSGLAGNAVCTLASTTYGELRDELTEFKVQSLFEKFNENGVTVEI